MISFQSLLQCLNFMTPYRLGIPLWLRRIHNMCMCGFMDTLLSNPVHTCIPQSMWVSCWCRMQYGDAIKVPHKKSQVFIFRAWAMLGSWDTWWLRLWWLFWISTTFANKVHKVVPISRDLLCHMSCATIDKIIKCYQCLQLISDH